MDANINASARMNKDFRFRTRPPFRIISVSVFKLPFDIQVHASDYVLPLPRDSQPPPLDPLQAAAPPVTSQPTVSMSMYSTNMENGMAASQAPQEPQIPKAAQACASCRKQKRKCSKTLPACDLCARMNRHCDYSPEAASPTSDDFRALQMKVAELESKLMSAGPGVMNPHTPYSTPSMQSSMHLSPENNGLHAYTPRQEITWPETQNKFPSIALLDRDAFTYGKILLPKPVVDLTGTDVFELLGDRVAVQAMIDEYFSTVHIWMPIISKKRLDRNFANPLLDGGSELALLFLSMKLIISKPQDGLECSQNPMYLSAKRCIIMMEAMGVVSLFVLQATLLVTWYEYGQAIYPAAFMSAGWCVRYGNLLGINSSDHASTLLGTPGSWTEIEERKRTWWGVLVADRVVSIGSTSVPSSQEPRNNASLPVNDAAWDAGETAAAIELRVESPIEDPVDPFARLCQASIMLGKVLAHCNRQKVTSETAHFGEATHLYGEISQLASKINDETTKSNNYLSLTSPLSLAFSSLYALCEPYSCPSDPEAKTKEAAEMQKKAIEDTKAVTASIVDFVQKIDFTTPSQQDLDRVSPIIMDALYSGAINYAWLVRETGREEYQVELERVRISLGRMGTRWRNAADYTRILEAQEFTYAVNAAAA